MTATPAQYDIIRLLRLRKPNKKLCRKLESIALLVADVGHCPINVVDLDLSLILFKSEKVTEMSERWFREVETFFRAMCR